MYTIKVVDPRRERTLWAATAAAQRACYARYGASKASADFDPFSGRVFAVAVIDDEGVPQAGARLHVRDAGHPLPIEAHFADEPLLGEELDRRARQGVGEVSGLWAAEGLAGTGIGRSIVAATTAHALPLGVRHLVAFVHQHHRFNDEVGFRLDERFPERAYPDERYRSTVRWCDARTLESADSAVRLAIFLQRWTVLRGERIRLELPVRAEERGASVGA